MRIEKTNCHIRLILCLCVSMTYAVYAAGAAGAESAESAESAEWHSYDSGVTSFDQQDDQTSSTNHLLLRDTAESFVAISCGDICYLREFVPSNSLAKNLSLGTFVPIGAATYATSAFQSPSLLSRLLPATRKVALRLVGVGILLGFLSEKLRAVNGDVLFHGGAPEKSLRFDRPSAYGEELEVVSEGDRKPSPGLSAAVFWEKKTHEAQMNARHKIENVIDFHTSGEQKNIIRSPSGEYYVASKDYSYYNQFQNQQSYSRDSSNIVEIYADGSCDNNGEGKRGGWASLIKWQQKEFLRFGSVPSTTNNRMELVALMEGLKRVQALEETNLRINLHTDSFYVISIFKKSVYYDDGKGNGKGNGKDEQKEESALKLPRSNPKLVREFLHLLASLQESDHVATLEWVPSHRAPLHDIANKQKYHQRVDRAAGMARKFQINRNRDIARD